LESFWEKWLEEQEPHVSTSTLNGYRQDRTLFSESFSFSAMVTSS
jgi:hypothetical protein